MLVGHNLWTQEIYDEMKNSISYDEYDKAFKYLERKAIVKAGKVFVRIKKDLWMYLDEISVYKYIYGSKMSKSFIDGFTGLKELEEYLTKLYNTERGITVGLGKKIWFKDARTALNYTLQASNSYVTKLWVFYTNQIARKRKMKIPEDYIPYTIIHDEINISIKKEMATILEAGIKLTNKSLGYKYPVEIESFAESDWSFHNA